MRPVAKYIEPYHQHVWLLAPEKSGTAGQLSASGPKVTRSTTALQGRLQLLERDEVFRADQEA